MNPWPSDRQSRESLHIKAAAIWATRDEAPIERGTVRDLSLYEQDLSRAVVSEQAPPRPRRQPDFPSRVIPAKPPEWARGDLNPHGPSKPTGS